MPIVLPIPLGFPNPFPHSPIGGTGEANEVAYFDSATSVTSSPRITRADSGNLLNVASGAATDLPILAVAHASQTNNLFEARTSGGNRLFEATATGGVGAYGTGGSFSATRFAAAATLTLLRANGSIGSESGVLSGETIGTVTARSWSGGTFPAYTNVSVGALSFLAAENHTGTSYGTYCRITTTPTGSTSAQVRLIISTGGNTLLSGGTSTEAGTNALRVLGIQASTAPSTSPVDMVQLASIDIDGAGTRALQIRDELGNVTEAGKWLKTPGGRRRYFVTKTANYTLTSADDVVMCNSASAFTLTLPAAASNSGQHYHVKNINTGIITIDGNGAETIDDAATQTLNQYDAVELFCDGAEWWIL